MLLRQTQAAGAEAGAAEGSVRVGPNRRVFALMGTLGLLAAAAPLLCLLAFPAALVGFPARREALEALLLCLGYVLVCGDSARFYLGTLLPGRAAVTIDAEGVRDRSSRFTPDVARWEEISSVWRRGSLLCVRVRDTEAFLARQRPLVRLLLRGNRLAGIEVGLCIARCNVGVPLERLQEQIEARLARHQNERRWWTQQR